jgi:alkanesulfonate monooxygenase SsuD/methylene tetrahydromethanopterin reductase-like flavin-dependent oxidoreductase (luciferase family)
MRRALVLSTPAFLPLVALAQAADRAGVDRLWTTESTPRDGLVRALTLGLRTQRIEVATGIAYAFTRSPLAMAAAAADVHIATGGRFAVGLGAGTKGMRTRRYGIHDFDHPGSRLGEYAELMRAAWQAEDGLAHHGRFYTAEVPGRLRSEELDGLPPIQVVGSGVNETMLRLSAKYCEGVALHPLVSLDSYLDRVAVPAIRAGDQAKARRAWIAAWRITSVADELEDAVMQARVNLAFYFTTPSYQTVTEGTYWEDTTARVRDSFRADPGQSFGDLARLVPPEMVDDFCLVGTPGTIGARASELASVLAERGVEELVFQVAGVGLDANTYVKHCHQLIENTEDVRA